MEGEGKRHYAVMDIWYTIFLKDRDNVGYQRFCNKIQRLLHQKKASEI